MKNTMDFATFTETIKAQLGNYLSEDYKDCEMKISHIKKSNGYEYEGLSVLRANDADGGICPVLNLSDAFERYEKGTSIEELCEKLADVRMNTQLPGNISRDNFTDFESMRDQIYPRLVNANDPILQGRPHRKVEDLAVLYGVRVSVDQHGFGEANVDDQLLDIWGVDEETLYEAAIANLEREDPVFMNLELAMFGALDGSEAPAFDPESIDMDNVAIPFFLLTNKQKVRGASVVLGTKFMDRIAKKLGYFYILPSSVHEVLIVPRSFMDDAEQLAEMVRQVNSDAVAPADRLSDTVYEYDAVTHQLIAIKGIAA